ncbi:hypothetical protein VNI00_019309, partial [Paramarasmius palmivorus]
NSTFPRDIHPFKLKRNQRSPFMLEKPRSSIRPQNILYRPFTRSEDQAPHCLSRRSTHALLRSAIVINAALELESLGYQPQQEAVVGVVQEGKTQVLLRQSLSRNIMRVSSATYYTTQPGSGYPSVNLFPISHGMRTPKSFFTKLLPQPSYDLKVLRYPVDRSTPAIPHRGYKPSMEGVSVCGCLGTVGSFGGIGKCK